MARGVTLATLRSRVRWRTDTENETTRFTASEVDDAINEGIAKLHSRIARTRGQGYYFTSTDVTTAADVESYALPATFLQLTKVFAIINDVECVLRPYEEVDTHGMIDTVSWQSISQIRYRLHGSNISFRPRPDSAYTVTLEFVPTAVKLVNASDVFDGIDGMDEYVVSWASKRLAMKNRDFELCGVLDAEMSIALQEVDGFLHARDGGAPPSMLDVRPLLRSLRSMRRRWAR